MPLQLTGRHMNISEETKDYIDKKVNRLRRLAPKIDEMSFTLSKEKLHFQADATFRAGKLAVKAKETAAQPLEAIDKLVDKLEMQITKGKEKLQDKKGANLDKARAALEAEEALPDEEVAEA